jgi:signal transduction histidine kinase
LCGALSPVRSRASLFTSGRVGDYNEIKPAGEYGGESGVRGFLRYKLNLRIFLSFLFIIIIPSFSSFFISYFLIQKTIHRETTLRLQDSITAYSQEIQFIERDCLKIASELAADKNLQSLFLAGNFELLQQELGTYYRLNLADIIEIEDRSGKVLLRAHNPTRTGDIKADQAIIRAGLAGKTVLSYEGGISGLAIRAVAPLRPGKAVLGLVMVGSLFSADFVEHIKLLTGIENGIYKNNRKIISTYEGLNQIDESDLVRLQSEPSLIIRTGLNDEPYALILKPLLTDSGAYWGALSMGIPQREANRYFMYSRNLLLLILGIGILAGLIIYIILAKNINSSLKSIISGIEGFSFDHFNSRIALERKDEFGKIAESFNSLVKKLRRYNDRISRLQDDMIKSAQLATTGQIAAGLAHEIRNPLSSMKMMAQIIRNRHLTADRHKEIDIVLKEIDRVSTVVTDLIEFAKPSPLKFAWHDLNGILEEVLTLFSYNLEHQDITTCTDFSLSLPLLFLDEEKTRLCVLNIILNAIQAMPGGGTLAISTALAANQHALVSICDSGEVIDQKNLEKIFDPFFTTKKEGTGLGLALSKMIIERHYGTISVTSGPENTCFKIVLPLDLYKRGTFV